MKTEQTSHLNPSLGAKTLFGTYSDSESWIIAYVQIIAIGNLSKLQSQGRGNYNKLGEVEPVCDLKIGIQILTLHMTLSGNPPTWLKPPTPTPTPYHLARLSHEIFRKYFPSSSKCFSLKQSWKQQISINKKRFQCKQEYLLCRPSKMFKVIVNMKSEC